MINNRRISVEYMNQNWSSNLSYLLWEINIIMIHLFNKKSPNDYEIKSSDKFPRTPMEGT